MPGATLVVKEFAETNANVAGLLKGLRQSHDARQRFTKMRLEIPNAQRIGPAAGEDGSARGIADRLLAIGALEDDATPREGIEVRRLHLGMAVAAEVGPEIVGGDQEHVGPRGGSSGGPKNDGQSKEREEGETEHGEGEDRGYFCRRVRSASTATVKASAAA